ncbi:TPA: phage tail protein [Enterobacter hormaechei subsp. xiangfangensis]
MSAKFYTLLTEIGAAKLASAAALGVPLKITKMAVGDGGGVLPTPSAQQTALIAEKRRADLNMLYIDPQNSSQIIAEQVIPETEGGWWIREVGLFDETGALIAVGNCPESYKPQLAEGSGRTQTVRMVLITSSTDNITLKIDPAVVLATRKYVDDKVLELKLYVDDQMAKHIAAADPHTQYAPKASPTLTGTPKAPTAAAGNNTTQLATTAFVQTAISALDLSDAKFLGRLLNVQTFTSSGTYTPTKGTKTIIVEVQGAGGAGGGSSATTAGNVSLGAGGAEGCYGKSLFSGLATSYSVTIGTGGKGVVGGSGGGGGTTSFGSLLSAGGGYGGGRMTDGASVSFVGIEGSTLPSPPTVTGANLFSSGYAGTFYFAIRLSNAYSAGGVTGMGGRSFFGAGGGSGTSSGAGANAAAYGSGGSGAKSWLASGSDVAYAGGNGANGVVVVWEYS